MPRRAPKIVDGMRGPEAHPASSADGKQEMVPEYLTRASKPQAQKPRAKPIVFQSVYGRHRVQITSPADHIDPATGIRTAARPKVAAFVDGEFRLPGDIDPKTGKLVEQFAYDFLVNHPKFGLGGDFWLASEAESRAKEVEYETLKRQVQADPALINRVLADLKGEEFPVEIPPREPDPDPEGPDSVEAGA